MFQIQFPKIIQAVLQYANIKNEYQPVVAGINEQLLKLVLSIMKNKSDFAYILKKLKKEFNRTQTVCISFLKLFMHNVYLYVFYW